MGCFGGRAPYGFAAGERSRCAKSERWRGEMRPGDADGRSKSVSGRL